MKIPHGWPGHRVVYGKFSGIFYPGLSGLGGRVRELGDQIHKGINKQVKFCAGRIGLDRDPRECPSTPVDDRDHNVVVLVEAGADRAGVATSDQAATIWIHQSVVAGDIGGSPNASIRRFMAYVAMTCASARMRAQSWCAWNSIAAGTVR